MSSFSSNGRVLLVLSPGYTEAKCVLLLFRAPCNRKITNQSLVERTQTSLFLTGIFIAITDQYNIASHADVLRGSLRVPAPLTSAGAGTRDEPLRTSAWEANITEL